MYRWVERAYGATASASVLALVPGPIAETFRTDGFNALIWYDLESTDLFVDAATATLMGGDSGRWRELARENFDQDLGPILRASSRFADAPSVLKRTTVTWSRLYDFGTIRVGDPVGHKATVAMDGFEAASLALRYITLGTVEGMLRSAGISDASARVTVGEANFAREFEYEVSWNRP